MQDLALYFVQDLFYLQESCKIFVRKSCMCKILLSLQESCTFLQEDFTWVYTGTFNEIDHTAK